MLAATVENVSGEKTIVNFWRDHYCPLLHANKDTPHKIIVEQVLRNISNDDFFEMSPLEVECSNTYYNSCWYYNSGGNSAIYLCVDFLYISSRDTSYPVHGFLNR